MKNIIISLTTLYSVSIQAQTFSEAPGNSFSGTNYSDIEFADIDNDNDLDLLITGEGSSGREAKLYTNDGQGNYTEVPNTFLDDIDTWVGAAFGDIDQDGDQDLLITAYSPIYQEYTELYTNDGNGNFTAVTNSIGNVTQGETAFIDLDNDSDLDLLITGYSDQPGLSLFAVTELYLNDGSGTFTEILSTPFDSVSNSAIAFADIDNDNDLDVILSGLNNLSQTVTKLYTNDGSANFTEVQNTPFQGIKQGDIAFADIDQDNDQDVLITGKTGGGQPFTAIYTNDGTGQFTIDNTQSVVAVQESAVDFSDIDGDNDLDLIISGLGTGLMSKLYINDGTGQFNELTGMPFEPVTRSAVTFADVDGDQDEDLLITGHNGTSPFTQLYLNTTALGIEAQEQPDMFNIYPNPFQNSTTLELNLPTQLAGLILTNSNGQVIRQFEPANTTTITINRDQLPSGLYYLTAVDQNGHHSSQKLVIE